MNPSQHGSLLFGLTCWPGRKGFTGRSAKMLFPQDDRVLPSLPLHLAWQGWLSCPVLVPWASLGILPSETKLTHYRDSPGRHRSCECVYTVNQHTLFNYSYFKLLGEKNTTLEQIPIVSFTFTLPASRSFPTGSNILLAMFNSYFTWGIESTKWFQLLRHYISVCPLLLPVFLTHSFWDLCTI